MCYFAIILLSDVVSSIGPKISDANTNNVKVIVCNKCICVRVHAQCSGFLRHAPEVV